MEIIQSYKTPSLGRGQRSVALPISCPPVTQCLELSPQFKSKGVTDEQFFEAIACAMVLSISHRMGSEYWYRVLRGPVGEDVHNCIHVFAGRLVCVIIELHVQQDQVHLLVKIPPKVSIPEFMGSVKGQRAIRVFKKFPYLREHPYRGKHFWAN